LEAGAVEEALPWAAGAAADGGARLDKNATSWTNCASLTFTVGIPPARILLVGWCNSVGNALPGNFFPTPISEGAKCVP
jgi:hypothetical protein